MSASRGFPRSAETIVVGAGTAGCVVAGRLAEAGREVLLLEAGPDYGPLDSGRWPPELLDDRALPNTHSWDYASSATFGQKNLPLERARVVGGCSAHNGCAAVWGGREDYDAWERAGNPGWGMEALLPYFRAASDRLRVHTPGRSEVGPFHEAVLDAAPAAGLPLIDDLNDIDGGSGMAISAINTHDHVRWSAAFGYLDPVRGGGRLTVAGDVLVDRVVVANGRATGVEAIIDGGRERIAASDVVLAGGAFGSPAILLRSGIGDPAELAAIGIAPVHPLPGVGRNLHDHVATALEYEGTPELVRRLEAFVAAGGWLREEGTIAKARSLLAAGSFDLHLYPVGSPYWPGGGAWSFSIPLANMTPLSRGTVRLVSADPADPPVLDHGYLTDVDGRDLAVLIEGVEVGRRLAASEPLVSLLGGETYPGPAYTRDAGLPDFLRSNAIHYYHPAGSCRMGPASDAAAVVDAAGRPHGLAGLRVADAAIMPSIPRANTNLPAAVVGERIAAAMLGRA